MKKKKIAKSVTISFSDDFEYINTPFGVYKKVEVQPPFAGSVTVPKLKRDGDKIIVEKEKAVK